MKTLNDVLEEITAVEAILSRELGEAFEGLDLREAVAMLVSQRENARNAHAATQEKCDRMEAALKDQLSVLDNVVNQGHCAKYADATTGEMGNVLFHRVRIIKALGGKEVK